jgi:hypothetical protein
MGAAGVFGVYKVFWAYVQTWKWLQAYVIKFGVSYPAAKNIMEMITCIPAHIFGLESRSA